MYVAWIESRNSPEYEYHNLMNLACSPSHDISTSNPHRRTPQIIVQAFKWDCLLMLMSSPGCCVHVGKTPWGIWPELSIRFVPTSNLKTWLRVTGLSGRCATVASAGGCHEKPERKRQTADASSAPNGARRRRPMTEGFLGRIMKEQEEQGSGVLSKGHFQPPSVLWFLKFCHAILSCGHRSQVPWPDNITMTF
jgi:hypothetical protein